MQESMTVARVGGVVVGAFMIRKMQYLTITPQLIAFVSLTFLYLLDSWRNYGQDSVAKFVFFRTPGDIDANSLQALRTVTYLELVFSLSAMFSASLFLCLNIIMDSVPAVRQKVQPREKNWRSGMSTERDYWKWISYHCKSRRRALSCKLLIQHTGRFSLLSCYGCMAAQAALYGWINRGLGQAVFDHVCSPGIALSLC